MMHYLNFRQVASFPVDGYRGGMEGVEGTG
ncbi:unnamed protein product, partial [Rotaria sp. Silwood1]